MLFLTFISHFYIQRDDMNIIRESILLFTFGKFSPHIEKLFEYRITIIFELYQYLLQHAVSDIDPRKYLFSHNPSKRKLSRIIPILTYEGLKENTQIFSITWERLQKLFHDRIDNAYISVLLPGAETRSYSENGSKKSRIYIPLIVPNFLSSGVWIEGRGVRHFMRKTWCAHFMSTKHSIFNYTNTNIYILVIDLNCAPKMEDIE